MWFTPTALNLKMVYYTPGLICSISVLSSINFNIFLELGPDIRILTLYSSEQGIRQVHAVNFLRPHSKLYKWNFPLITLYQSASSGSPYSLSAQLQTFVRFGNNEHTEPSQYRRKSPVPTSLLSCSWYIDKQFPHAGFGEIPLLLRGPFSPFLGCHGVRAPILELLCYVPLKTLVHSCIYSILRFLYFEKRSKRFPARSGILNRTGFPALYLVY